MSASLPTGLRGRLLAVGLLLLMVTGVYSLVAAPLHDLHAERAATAETRRAFLAKLQAVGAELPALRQRQAQLQATAGHNKLTLDGPSDAVASAGLQSHLTELAAAAGVTIGSTESLPTQRQNGYRRLGLRLLVSGPYDALIKLLARIELATPPLLVDSLQMHSLQRRRGATTVASLDASLEVFGFRPDEATTADNSAR